MSRGLGRTERAILEIVESTNRCASVWWIEKQLSKRFYGSAVRRAVSSLVRKGLLYKNIRDGGKRAYAPGAWVHTVPVEQWFSSKSREV